VQHAWFLDNTASLDGGGLYARGGGLNVQLAKFKNNTCSNNGGGLYLEGMHTVAIDQVSAPWPSVMEDPWPLSITENECENGYGGGLFITNCPAVWMNRLSIYSNRAMAAAGAYIDTAFLESRNALFARNDPDVYAAAGALMLVNSTCAVFQTTIVDNEETAIAMDSNTTLALEESIVWNHQTQIWGGGSPGTAQVYYCCIQDPSYSPVFNTTSNPCLYPNYHLRYNSPCIDLGALAMGYDFDHETRIFQNDAGFDEFVDMDLDRLPNIVETATGTWVDEMNTGTSWIDADWDDDGYNDGMEWLAGTDPFDSASYLGFVNVLPIGTNCHLTWQGGTGRDQFIMVATNVPNPVWHTIYTNVAPAGITNTATLGAAGNPLIFAVGVKDPVP
jgi:predicted outer membrane repeat protein